MRGARDAKVVRELASHQCGLGSNPGVDPICGLSLFLVLSFALRGFSPGTPVFPSSQKLTLCGSRKYPDLHHGGNWKFQGGGGWTIKSLSGGKYHSFSTWVRTLLLTELVDHFYDINNLILTRFPSIQKHFGCNFKGIRPTTTRFIACSYIQLPLLITSLPSSMRATHHVASVDRWKNSRVAMYKLYIVTILECRVFILLFIFP